MAKRELKLGEVVLMNVRLSFPHLFEPTSAVADGPKKYRADFLMDPTTKIGKRNIAACEKAKAAVEKETFGKDGQKYKDGRCMLKDGNDCENSSGEIYQGYEDMMVVSASNGTRIPIVDADKTPLAKDDGKPYGGCYVNAVVRFYGMKDPDKGGKGLFASLETVQFYKDGEAFGAEPADPDDYFDDVSDFEDEADDDSDDDLV